MQRRPSNERQLELSSQHVDHTHFCVDTWIPVLIDIVPDLVNSGWDPSAIKIATNTILITLGILTAAVIAQMLSNKIVTNIPISLLDSVNKENSFGIMRVETFLK